MHNTIILIITNLSNSTPKSTPKSTDQHRYMFGEKRVEELRCMYDLFKRVPSTLNILRDYMGQYVKRAGTEVVGDQECMRTPVLFVQRILDLKAKFDDFILESFHAEKAAQRKLKDSFEDFVNHDQRTASHLASYVDDLLKNSLKGVSEADAEIQLDRFVVIFRYLTDKDIFENFYKGLLSKRLLSGKSLSDDLEKQMIAKLKAECGYQFTSKLEGMFTDMQLSKGTLICNLIFRVCVLVGLCYDYLSVPCVMVIISRALIE